jgi:hypothetical protein
VKTRRESFRLHVDDESTKIARTICDANPRAKNKRRAIRGHSTGELENDAIEFAGGFSMRTPTWRASCRCFTACPPRGIPEVVSFR